jgi:hypothetical protein
MSLYDSNSNIQSMPWLSNSKSINSKVNINTMYPLFNKLSEHIDDSYWKSIFLDCAKGKFVKGFSYNNNTNTLLFRITGKSIIIDDSLNSINKIIDFVRSNAGIRSPMDLEREKDYEREHQAIHVNMNNWSKILKFNKKLIIIEYVSKMRKLYDLTQKETDQLTTLINMNMNEDVIKKNIILDDDNILKINGLEWDPLKRKFYLINEVKKAFISKSDPCNVIYIEENIPLNTCRVDTVKEWIKFIKEFNKFTKKNSSNVEEPTNAYKVLTSSENFYEESSNS